MIHPEGGQSSAGLSAAQGLAAQGLAALQAYLVILVTINQ
jgi:hypothetical protein